MGKGWFPNYDLADFEAMVLLDHSVTPDSEGYDFFNDGPTVYCQVFKST